ncbi:MAG: endonuclease/exonuclease/phosphatase family protein [bacterium]|jgi:endonuclease/exonuclease/phosphatase family metal-dependent hydrolase
MINFNYNYRDLNTNKFLNKEVDNISNVSNPEIKLTTYNVENLFDKYDDPNKSDGPSKKDKELKALAEILKQNNSDIVALQEVENKEILQELLNMAGLKDKYNIIVGKSDDRGIATALLIDKKFPIKKIDIHQNDTTFKRPPVEAIVELAPGFNVKIFSVHLKSKRGGEESDIQRKKEASKLVEYAKKDNMPTILMGDFNDSPDSSTISIIKNNEFTDVRQLDSLSKETNLPTHYSNNPKYGAHILDYIFLNDKAKEKLNVVQGSFDITGKYDNPLAAVASDHRAVSIKLNLQNIIYSKFENALT